MMDKFDEKAREVYGRVTRDNPGWGWYDMAEAFAQALRDVDREMPAIRRIYDVVTRSLAEPAQYDTAALIQIAAICEEVMPTEPALEHGVSVTQPGVESGSGRHFCKECGDELAPDGKCSCVDVF